MRNRPVPLAVVGVLVIVVLSLVALFVTRAVSTAGSSKLVWGAGWMSAGSGPNVAGKPYTYGDMDPCVDHGSVTVTKIAATQSAGVKLSAWGSRPNPFENGVTRVNVEDGGGKIATVIQAGFQTGPRILRNLCREGEQEKDGYEFAIELVRTGSATGWTHGLTVTYRSGGGTHTAHWQRNYVQCGSTQPSYPDSGMEKLCS